jgi:hypothetical protein
MLLSGICFSLELWSRFLSGVGFSLEYVLSGMLVYGSIRYVL